MAIIDHLHDDKPSLEACSLVCKAWTHPAHFHLFTTLTLKWPLQPTVFPFVRHLRILFDERHHDGTRTPIWDQVAPLLIGFHRITSLTIILLNRSLNDVSAQTWLELGENFSRTVSLSLVYLEDSNTSCVVRAICAFPCLRELHLRGATRALHDLASATTFRPSPVLDTLDLHIWGVAAVLEWLLSLPVRITPRNIRLYHLDGEDLAVLHKFIGAFGNDLQSISLSLFMRHWTPHSIDLTPLTQLRSIQFRIGAGVQPWITQVLSQISSPHLEDVAFQLLTTLIRERPSYYISNCLEWHNVDAILQGPTFSRLKNVHFYSDTPVGLTSPQSSSARSIIMQRLPLCRSRGIVRIRFDYCSYFQTWSCPVSAIP